MKTCLRNILLTALCISWNTTGITQEVNGNVKRSTYNSKRSFNATTLKNEYDLTDTTKTNKGSSIFFIVDSSKNDPKHGDNSYHNKLLVNSHIIVWRNGKIQGNAGPTKINADSTKGKITFHPALVAGDWIYIESTQKVNSDEKDELLFTANPIQLNLGIYDNNDKTFSLRWSSNGSSLSLSPHLVGLDSTNLTADSPGMRAELLQNVKDQNKGRSTLDNAYPGIMAYYQGKVIFFDQIMREGYTLDSALSANPEFIYVVLGTSVKNKVVSPEQAMAKLRKVYSTALSKGIPVFWLSYLTQGEFGQESLNAVTKLTDSVRTIWPNRYFDRISNPTNHLGQMPIESERTRLNHPTPKDTSTENHLLKVFDRFNSNFQPINGINSYIIETSVDSLTWTNFDSVQNHLIVKKNYSHKDTIEHFYRVKAKFINGQQSAYSNSVKAKLVGSHFKPDYNGAPGSERIDLKGVTITLCCLLTASKSTFFRNNDSLDHAFTMKTLYKSDTLSQSVKIGDTIYIFGNYCSRYIDRRLVDNQRTFTPTKNINLQNPFLKLSGTVQYDFTYRSRIDTPFLQNDFRQHTLQTSVNVVIKDSYPFRINVLTRKSNSSYFSNIADVNVHFSSNSFLNKIKESLYSRLNEKSSMNTPTEADRLLNEKRREISEIQGWLDNPARIQEMMNEKGNIKTLLVSNSKINLGQLEKLKNDRSGIINGVVQERKDGLFEKIKSTGADKKDSILASLDSLKAKALNDSTVATKVKGQYESKREQLQKLLKEKSEYESKVKTIRKTTQDSINNIKHEIQSIKDPTSLKVFVKHHDIKDLPSGWQSLMSINSVGIGRTWVDYSELTVKNVSLTGFNIETSPSPFYVAFAAGKLNYRFRDLIFTNREAPKQSLWLMRAGLGRKEGNNLILTYYNGKRSILNPYNNSVSLSPLEKIIGVSLENRINLNRNSYAILEIAKSSFQNTGTLSLGNSQLASKALNLKDRSNEAYSFKLNSFLPKTATRITALYKKMGAHFQSFNLQPVNVDQESFQFRVQQSFFRKRLLIDAAIRKNDFDNQFVSSALSSRSVFKSLQASLRIPNYPFLSFGFYPSSQLTIMDNNVLVENQYNTLSGIISHSFKLQQLNVNANVVYLRFYNNSSDSGFIYYNAHSFSVTQNTYYKEFQFQSGCTMNRQLDLNVLTIEQVVGYRFIDRLMITGGIKYNRVNSLQTLLGGSGNMTLTLPKLGTFQFLYDRSYLPDNHRQLLPMDMGRLGYSRSF